jgi:hypothetical protein
MISNDHPPVCEMRTYHEYALSVERGLWIGRAGVLFGAAWRHWTTVLPASEVVWIGFTRLAAAISAAISKAVIGERPSLSRLRRARRVGVIRPMDFEVVVLALVAYGESNIVA